MPGRKRSKGLLLSVLLLSPFASGCDGKEGVPPSAGAQPGAGVLRIEVATGTAQRGQLQLQTRSVGLVAPWQSAGLRAEAGGRVQVVHVDNGDMVAAGDPLVKIDSSRQSIAVSAARAQVEGLQEDLAYAKREAQRKRRLVERGSAASVTLDAAEHAVTMATSGLTGAEANLRSARRQAKDGRVTAPFAGIVTQRMVDAGDTTAPGAPLLEIVDLARLRVRVGVAGAELANIEVGGEAQVRVEDLGGLVLPAKVASIAPSAHLVTGLFDVELHADNIEGRVRGGMVASVEFAQAASEDGLLLPREAITRRGGRTVVFQIKDGVALERTVVVGASDAIHTQVLRGIDAGAQVATSALHTLAEGVLVEAITAVEAPSVASAEP